MRRVCLIVWVAVIALLYGSSASAQQVRFGAPAVAGAATPAAPQGSGGFCSLCFFFGFVGEDYDSSHQDGGNVGVTKRFPWSPGGMLKSEWVGEFRAEKEWDYSYALHFVGGLRLVNDSRFKYPYFYEITAGVAHYPGDTVFELHPSFGILFPRQGKDWGFYGRVGLPIEFFSGNAEVGTEFAVGLTYGRK